MYKIFIDGREGTTGLQIYERLEQRKDLQLLMLPESLRKDTAARKEMLNAADISFLCLPDAAAIEAVSLVKNPGARIIDASTAHRTDPGWVYGFPEISQHRRMKIAGASRVANPGCHATGFISLVAPLERAKVVGPDFPFIAHSLTGYSGGGKKTIAQYNEHYRDPLLDSAREYALTMCHKHIPEMMRECGLLRKPIFNPIICDFYAGMCVVVPLFRDMLDKKWAVSDFAEYYKDYYAGANFIKVADPADVPAYLASNLLSGTNELEIFVSGNNDQIFLAAVLDNLGKGASGAAVQNMNIMLGLDEATGLK